MKANLISMNILVDSSGSMESIASDMVGALNQLVDENRELDVLVTYSIFSNNYQSIFVNKPIRDVGKFELRPDSMTALIESTCKMIDEVGARFAAQPEEERPEKVMFVIVTDGLENRSAPEYTRERLMAKIKEQTEVYNWLFLYLGANQDAIQVAESYGISRDKAIYYDLQCAKGTGAVLSRKLHDVACCYSIDEIQNVKYDEKDREELRENPKKPKRKK